MGGSHRILKLLRQPGYFYSIEAELQFGILDLYIVLRRGVYDVTRFQYERDTRRGDRNIGDASSMIIALYSNC